MTATTGHRLGERTPPRNGTGTARGFTMIEMAIVVAIIAIVAGLAWASLGGLRQRTDLSTEVADVQSLIHGARLQGLADGKDVAVLLFPQYVSAVGTGRIVVYEDGDVQQPFFSTNSTLSLDTYLPATPGYAAASQVLAVHDLPSGITVGPAAGMGAGAVLVAPLAGINVQLACSFCSVGGDGRGAIRFDSRGRAWFYPADGPALPNLTGASFSLTSATVGGARTFVITSATGAVSYFDNG